MALWMDPGQEPTTDAEKADLDAIAALRESAVLELKEEGNEFLKKGKQFYSKALDAYSKAIIQGCSNELTNSVLYGNRAQVNLLLGNFRRALSDAEVSITRNPSNIKVGWTNSQGGTELAIVSLSCTCFEYSISDPSIFQAYFRAAKASIELGLLAEAGQFCSDGLSYNPESKELRILNEQVARKVEEDVQKKKRALEAQSNASALVSALTSRNIRLGNALYTEKSQGRGPWLDSSQILHWPVLLLYGELMTSDLVEDFCEIESFSVHLDEMFGKGSPPLLWDERHEYSRDRVLLHYYANADAPLSRNKTLKLLLGQGAGCEQTAAEYEESEEITKSSAENPKPRWIQVSENETLNSVLSRTDHIVPGIPVFYVTARGTSFNHILTSGQWCPP
eukprot:TRINITY_DN6027_c0_g1_i1.p1 TRINITY_DN6027_c0_g1~~TRINITY_DN6027_c0_g1_i1.p1  ORF type:complete len:393 (-),score=63.74 TRINITY_DN6027_c0_g1_i1:269-1447(-)